MGYYKPQEVEECSYYYLECDICEKTIDGEEIELQDKGWAWAKIESQSTENRSVVIYLAKITVAACPKHTEQLGKVLLEKMYSLEENPPVG